MKQEEEQSGWGEELEGSLCEWIDCVEMEGVPERGQTTNVVPFRTLLSLSVSTDSWDA